MSCGLLKDELDCVRLTYFIGFESSVKVCSSFSMDSELVLASNESNLPFFPQQNEAHRGLYSRATPHTTITQHREHFNSRNLNVHLAYMDIRGVKPSDVDWVPFIIMMSDFGWKGDALERRWGKRNNILREKRQLSPSRNIFTDTGCWKIGIYTSCFLLIWIWLQAFPCRKISIALANCNYTCWGEKGDVHSFFIDKRTCEKIWKNI